MNAVSGAVEEPELNAHLDGQLPSGRAAAVAAYLAAHPEAQARLQQYAQQQQVLRDAIAAQSAEPPPARLRVMRLAAAGRRRQLRRLAAAAAAVLLLFVGGVGGWTARRAESRLALPEASGMRAFTSDAIDAYRVFSVEVRHPVEVDAGHETHLVQWLSKRLGRPLVVPDFAKLGFQLMGGRLLPSDNGAAAQLMYDDKKGSRLTVYYQPVGFAGAGTEFRYRQSGGIGTFYWSEEGFGYAIAGKADRDLLLKAAEIVYRQITATGGKARMPPPPGKAS
jgi:anti-sigma factor RsiW